MSKQEHLLRLEPEDSLNLMVTNANDLRYPLYGLRAAQPVAEDGTVTRVQLTARDRVAKNDPYPYSGSISFQYRRLSLADTFAGTLDGYRPQLPTSTQVVLDELTRRSGIAFTKDDIVLEEIGRNNSAPYVLKAKAESLRWVGELPIVLADLYDLEEVFADMDELDIPAYPTSHADYSDTNPFVNLTPTAEQIPAWWSERPAQEYPELVALMNERFPDMSVQMSQSQRRWHVSSTPSAFNLYNAVIEETGIVLDSLVNPELNTALRIRLDLEYCTNISTAMVLVYYRRPDTIEHALEGTPRLLRSGTLMTTDGSEYASYLDLLEPLTVIRHVPAGGLYIDGEVPWIADPDRPSARNLYGAVVQYRGPKRWQDSNHIDPTMTHVAVVTLDERYNSLWRGNFTIYYRGGAA